MGGKEYYFGIINNDLLQNFETIGFGSVLGMDVKKNVFRSGFDRFRPILDPYPTQTRPIDHYIVVYNNIKHI